MHFRLLILVTGLLVFIQNAYAQNVGVGTASPQAKLSVGTNSEFRVDGNGNLIRINNVPYSFPSTQATSGQVLTNNGSGLLTWSSQPAVPSAFGSGSAGALTVGAGATLDLTTTAGIASLSGGYNMDYTTITVASGGTLIVPSGLVLRATGNITINGTVTVLPSDGNTMGHPGVGKSGSDIFLGALGVNIVQASSIIKAPHTAGGASRRGQPSSLGAILDIGTGGEGGGGLTLYSGGNIVVSGAINANGNNGVNPQTAGRTIVGVGGGGGGIVVLVAQGTFTNSGTIRANGGNGAIGFDGNGGTPEGGGGGGGGGIVTIIASSTPTLGTIQVNGGTGGANSNAGANTSMLAGNGGGASGGNGGNGGHGYPLVGIVTSTSGQAGHVLQIVASNPGLYLLGRN